MALYNPHRNYDKGMDDAYMGYMPQNSRSQEYMEGYEYAEWLLALEQATKEIEAEDKAQEITN